MGAFLRQAMSALLHPSCRRQEASWSGKSFRILTYHRVNEHRPQDRLSVSPAAFAEQLDLLQAEGHGVTALSDAVAGMGAGAWPERAVVIAFDDGYADNCTHALPLLRERGMPACVFVTVDWVGTSGPVPGCAGGTDQDRALTWDEVRDLAQSGVEIGSHTLTHAHLDTLSEDKLRQELAESKARLEQALSQPVTLLAYPRGRYNDRVIAVAREVGYVAAVTVRPGRNTGGMSPLELQRTEVSGFDRLVDFQRKLDGAFDWLHRLAQAT